MSNVSMHSLMLLRCSTFYTRVLLEGGEHSWCVHQVFSGYAPTYIGDLGACSPEFGLGSYILPFCQSMIRISGEGEL